MPPTHPPRLLSVREKQNKARLLPKATPASPHHTRVVIGLVVLHHAQTPTHSNVCHRIKVLFFFFFLLTEWICRSRRMCEVPCFGAKDDDNIASQKGVWLILGVNTQGGSKTGKLVLPSRPTWTDSHALRRSNKQMQNKVRNAGKCDNVVIVLLYPNPQMFFFFFYLCAWLRTKRCAM